MLLYDIIELIFGKEILFKINEFTKLLTIFIKEIIDVEAKYLSVFLPWLGPSEFKRFGGGEAYGKVIL